MQFTTQGARSALPDCHIPTRCPPFSLAVGGTCFAREPGLRFGLNSKQEEKKKSEVLEFHECPRFSSSYFRS